ncbi:MULTISPECIES: VanZ family protein [unclassified Photobacterium]|uniref:VanZ family protein n=1 Tax=unclassified Photobacterium TaxID=2628852 RepID=UPI001EE05763|nr:MULTISPECIES: VanZ family protein [unclassified Photobacterium]MCG3862587.1 VanZ family protein [Photobacterium sp. Ph6]MCG3874118.1 VanZ family protein [Photobacterium sp. Ph5]
MSTLLNFIKINWKVITLLILTLITILSLSPQPSLPQVPGTDKTHHFIAYSALIFAIGLKMPKNWYWLFIGFIAWSGAIELIQPYVNRYGEWLDLAANTGGLISGFILARIFYKIFLSK